MAYDRSGPVLARSVAGHDRGRLYLVLEEEERSLLLTDGRLRPLSYPKRKNRIHVRIIRRIPEAIAGMKTERDEQIRAMLRAYENRSGRSEEEDVRSEQKTGPDGSLVDQEV